VVSDSGRLRGFNYDYEAAAACLERALGARRRRKRSPLAGKRVAVLGAGGVARTIAFAAADRGASVAIYNRTLKRAKRLAADLGAPASAHPLKAVVGTDYDILVNATSVGMTPEVDATPVPVEALRKGALVFDTIYTPLETRLVREAREVGCTAITGLEMFLAQAARQFTLWTGSRAPLAVMHKVAAARLREGT
jgi:3-dehydroquinate dehydratase/shikimate dehydrogenase